MTRTDVTSLDLRSIPTNLRHDRIFETFDALPEDGSIVLVNDHDPRPLYYEFKSVRPDTFGWHVIVSGPQEWRIELRRLKPKESETGIQPYFERDHDEIDVIFGYVRHDVREAAQHPERPVAPVARLFDEFDARLERHIRWEEEILFPAVEEKSPPMAFGPGRVMRMEHVEIRRIKAKASERLHQVRVEPDALRAASQELDQVLHILSGHNQKEESVYYPMSEQMFSAPEAADILKRVRALK